ncbi:MAG: hypothetical protein Fur0016_03420 [Anaerolineales bacterium]
MIRILVIDDEPRWIDEALQAYQVDALYTPKSLNPRHFVAQIREVMPASG